MARRMSTDVTLNQILSYADQVAIFLEDGRTEPSTLTGLLDTGVDTARHLRAQIQQGLAVRQAWVRADADLRAGSFHLQTTRVELRKQLALVRDTARLRARQDPAVSPLATTLAAPRLSVMNDGQLTEALRTATENLSRSPPELLRGGLDTLLTSLETLGATWAEHQANLTRKTHDCRAAAQARNEAHAALVQSLRLIQEAIRIGGTEVHIASLRSIQIESLPYRRTKQRGKTAESGGEETLDGAEDGREAGSANQAGGQEGTDAEHG
jgi:hypothetical protein